jgi:hypothetical protein
MVSKIAQLKAQLEKLAENRQALLAETAIADDADYPAVKDTEELSERIAQLEAFEVKFKEKFEKKLAGEYHCLKQCRAVLQLDKEIQVLERKIRTLERGPQPTPALQNETIVEGEVGEVVSRIADASNVPEAQAKEVMAHQQALADKGISNKTLIARGAKAGKVVTGMLNFDFSPQQPQQVQAVAQKKEESVVVPVETGSLTF